MPTRSGRVGTLSRRVFHVGKIGSFGVEEVELPSGRRCTLDVLEHPGAAAAVVFVDAERIVLLRQYRHAARGWLWEVPAGKLDEGETPLACVQREIEEETGLRPRRVDLLGQILPAPGYTDERIHLYLAADVEPGTMAHGADEEIEVHEVGFEEALAMIDRGDIIDAKSIAALHLAERARR